MEGSPSTHPDTGRRSSKIPILFIDDGDDVDPRRRLFSSPTVSAEPEVALALARGQRRRLQAAAAAAAAEAEAAAAAEAEAEAAAGEEAADSSPDLKRPPPSDRLIRTLTRSTESFTLLEVAVRLKGHKGGAYVRVPIRRAWTWSICLAEVQSRLLEASAIGEGVQVTALRAAVPPHARVVRAADLAPGEVLEALLDHLDDSEAASTAAAEAEAEAEAKAEAEAEAKAEAEADAKAETKAEAEAEAEAKAGARAGAEATLEAMATEAGAMAVPSTRRDAPARAQLLAAAPCRLAATPRASPVARVVATLIALVAVAAITYGGAAGETGAHRGAHGDGRSSLSGAAPAAVSLEEGTLTDMPSPFGCAWTWPNNCRALDAERATCTFRIPFRAQGACLASSLL